jgi:hypothetical protein
MDRFELIRDRVKALHAPDGRASGTTKEEEKDMRGYDEQDKEIIRETIKNNYERMTDQELSTLITSKDLLKGKAINEQTIGTYRRELGLKRYGAKGSPLKRASAARQRSKKTREEGQEPVVPVRSSGRITLGSIKRALDEATSMIDSYIEQRKEELGLEF